MVAVATRVRDDAGVRGPSRVGWAWFEAASLSVASGAVGFWIGGGLGAGLGIAAGGLTPLLIERATRKQRASQSAKEVEKPSRAFGPSHLLEPGLGVVPFTGRRAELELLEQWCDAPGSLVRLVTGAGGSGKTRLALELCERMAERGWQCVTVAEGAEDDVVQRERAARPRARLLLITDYAETRTELEELLNAALQDEGLVRLLLLARHAGDWWQRLGAGTGAVRDLVTTVSQEQMQLAGDLDPGLSAEDLVRQAIPFFAARLSIPAPETDRVHVTTGEAQVLDLHAAALVAVLESSEQPSGIALQVNTEMVLATLLAHEKHYWRGRADAAGLLSRECDHLNWPRFGLFSSRILAPPGW
jgi:NAD(P)-dependent dehydrogenase (short-subunit alcohol dehydrogenase family)